MEQQDPSYTKPDLTSAICELNSMNRPNGVTAHGRRIVRPTPTKFSNEDLQKLQIGLNPTYISKITNSSRRVVETYLRMRPYFIPERARTKSENSVERYTQCENAIDDFSCTFWVAQQSSNSNTSMMDTCDGYGTMDSAASNSSSASIVGPSNTIIQTNNRNALLLVDAGTSKTGKQIQVRELKKSKSLENIRGENIDGSQPSHEMEFVSSRIQKLKVQE